MKNIKKIYIEERYAGYIVRFEELKTVMLLSNCNKWEEK
jgi:hypothetical protein